MPLYSYSRINTFFNCPRKYKFGYIEKPDIEKPRTIESFLGSVVHDTLEQCYLLIRENKALSENELLALYKRLWNEDFGDDVVVVNEDKTIDDYFEVGKRCLRLYHKRYYPFDEEMTLGLELKIHIALDDDGKYKLTGFVDRLSRDSSGRLHIHDYKTGGRLPTQPEIDEEEQLAIYQLAIQGMYPDNNGIDLIWHFLQFDTPLVTHRTADQLNALRDEYITRIKAIEQAAALDDFPTKTSGLCKWCEYQSICPAFGNTGAQEQEPQLELGQLASDEIAKLVDQYVELDKQRKSIDSQLKTLKEELASQSRDKAGDFFKGTAGFGVKISKNTQYKLPTKSADPEAFGEITALIRTTGVYDEHSVLDIRSVEKALKDCRMDESLLESLRAYARSRTSTTVRIAKAPLE